MTASETGGTSKRRWEVEPLFFISLLSPTVGRAVENAC